VKEIAQFCVCKVYKAFSSDMSSPIMSSDIGYEEIIH
jgi:hypothetical protein